MSDYSFSSIESYWQAEWQNRQADKVPFPDPRPKHYVLDMFPYPSGAGLHVGHPLGYIATDIYSRFKKMKGFNVLHPMGFDSFGLPAEQYAIQTGQHPAKTTADNIARYKEQMNKLGMGYDWEREIRTTDPHYYRWTQWIFLQLFHSYYDPELDKAMPIERLIAHFAEQGMPAWAEPLTGNIEDHPFSFTADEWNAMDEKRQQGILQHYRLAYLSETMVNWCPALGTVLANDEVKDGFSERGGHPVERKKMKQWSLRITAYSERLLQGLDTLDWSDAIKESQRNWIGRSEGAMIRFQVIDQEAEIEVFTTRPDTLFGVSFLTLAPEHELVAQLTTDAQREAVEAYVKTASNRSERERQADVKHVSGVFTGSYVKHPFSGQPIPVWIGDYVLVGYGTGAVMAVPAGDERDWRFATHFQLPIPPIFVGHEPASGAMTEKTAVLCNSSFLDGLDGYKAIRACIEQIEKADLGKGKVNYRLRDAAFGRQRYWGEPIPIYYKDGIPYPLKEEELPLVLPEIDTFLPTESGEPPLARATEWKYQGQYAYETSTMPGWAGSSWYFMRYMDPHNHQSFASPEALQYWQNVDVYLGGSEHATGHLLYVRFWTKFLFDRGWISFDEPAKKLINQGMIQGRSSFAYQKKGSNVCYSADLVENPDWLNAQGLCSDDFIQIHIPVQCVRLDIMDMEKLRQCGMRDLLEKEWVSNGEGVFRTTWAIEKMSKSKYNVVNPDDIIAEYGADTLRMYEMFLGPLELSKPWDTHGIEGVFRFLKKLWTLCHTDGVFALSDEAATEEELRILHKTIKKVEDDIQRFSFNTAVSSFMICLNELQALKCRKREAIGLFVRMLFPFAPHISAEIARLGQVSDLDVWPDYNPDFLVENSFEYPVSENGKLRVKISLPLGLSAQEIEAAVMAHEGVQRFLNGRSPKKVVVVPGRIVNFVV